MGSFLEQWNDPALEVDLAWDQETFAELQRARIIVQAAMAHHASQVPRRLGPDAEPAELAADRKISKKVYARSLTMLKLWGGHEADIGEYAFHQAEKVLQEGAQVIWADWWADHRAFLHREMRVLATTCIKTGNFKTGNSFLNRLLNELNVLGQLFEGRE